MNKKWIDSRLTNTWHNIKQRCENLNDKKYKNYGGKGIKLKLTKDELELLWIKGKASELKQPSIHRINSDGDYTFKNCKFIEMSENRKNKSKHYITSKRLLGIPLKTKQKTYFIEPERHKRWVKEMHKLEISSLSELIRLSVEEYIKRRY